MFISRILLSCTDNVWQLKTDFIWIKHCIELFKVCERWWKILFSIFEWECRKNEHNHTATHNHLMRSVDKFPICVSQPANLPLKGWVEHTVLLLKLVCCCRRFLHSYTLHPLIAHETAGSNDFSRYADLSCLLYLRSNMGKINQLDQSIFVHLAPK